MLLRMRWGIHESHRLSDILEVRLEDVPTDVALWRTDDHGIGSRICCRVAKAPVGGTAPDNRCSLKPYQYRFKQYSVRDLCRRASAIWKIVHHVFGPLCEERGF